MPKPKRALFLASESPRRSQILESYRIPFTKIPNLYEEPVDLNLGYSPREIVRDLCKKKAISSQSKYQGIIVGFDTIVVYKKGVEVARKVGGLPEQQMRDFLKENI